MQKMVFCCEQLRWLRIGRRPCDIFVGIEQALPSRSQAANSRTTSHQTKSFPSQVCAAFKSSNEVLAAEQALEC